MSGGFGAGLVEGLQSEQKQLHDMDVDDARLKDEHAATTANVKSTTDADTRANEMQPGALDEQAARTDQTKASTAQTVQTTKQSALAFTPEQQLRNYTVLKTKLELNDEQMLNLHNAALETTKALNAEVAHGDKIDTGQLEGLFNAGAPDGHKIKPGSLQVTADAKNPGASQISYVGDDGKPHISTLQNWNDMSEAFMPPKAPVVLSSDQTAYDATTHQPIMGAAPGTVPLGKTDPTAWTGQAARQVATNNGGTFDENGNLKIMDPKLSARVGKLSGIATTIGKQTGYSVPAPTVAAAVQSVADGGIDPDDPKFMPTVMSKLQAPASGYGANPPAAPAGGQGAGTAATPYPEGTRLQDASGNLFIVQNGQPVPQQ